MASASTPTWSAVAVQHAPADDGEDDVVLVGAVDERRVRVVDRREVRARDVDGDEVGALAGLEAADVGLPCPAPRRRRAWRCARTSARRARVTSRSTARCRNSIVRISSNMSMMLLDAGLSVPRPTRTPSCSRSASGAMPQPSLALLLGQCATATSLRAQDADVVARDVDAVHGEEVARRTRPTAAGT